MRAKRSVGGDAAALAAALWHLLNTALLYLAWAVLLIHLFVHPVRLVYRGAEAPPPARHAHP